jgi:glycosyltransferase involved in cell wall biosynthesis
LEELFETMIDFTVAIPTYNGASRLPEVLEKLQGQIETETMAWEIIVIDNNSNDNTAQVVREFQSTWNYPFPLKYYFEPQQGLAFARQRAVTEANGAFIGFIDDDNLAASDWVARSHTFGQQNPKAGAYGGQIHAAFEAQPPENFDNIIGFLAIRERGNTPQLYNPKVLSLPPGAGLVVRKKAWCDCVPEQLFLKGRTNNSLICGSDWEPLIHMHKAGWEIWYNPAMHIEHKIPSSRLQKDYLLSLIHSSCLCFFPLRVLQAKNLEKPVLLARTIFGNLAKAVLFYIKNRHKIKADLVAECELQIYLSRVASPFYFFRTRWAKKFS